MTSLLFNFSTYQLSDRTHKSTDNQCIGHGLNKVHRNISAVLIAEQTSVVP